MQKRYSFLIVIVLLLLYADSFSQELTPPQLQLPSTKGVERNPQALVAKLISGKESDKDKFDALFTWVTRNIHYDYATYLAPRGASMPQLKRILKTKSGICIDYAYLMDTLCKIAGLQNVSVYGYAKDDLFDVEDSIYIDNHAWNAVKLDDSWYVYDATWSAGKYHLEFRKFSNWILKTEKKLYKTKKKTFTFKPRFNAECEHEKFTVTYNVLPLWRYLLIWGLHHIPLRVHWVLDKNVNANYYLVNPEAMAVTHFPDDPKWALTQNYPGIRAFEVDPKYYHLEDTLYERQVRTGRYCQECNDWFALDDLEKEKQMKRNTIQFNPRNHFTPFNSDYNIATIFYKRSIPLEDSTSKIQHLDSALLYLNLARENLRKASRDVTLDYRLLRAKNAKKLKLLQTENKGYQSFVHTMRATTDKSTGAMKKFIARTRVTELRLKSDRKKLKKLFVRTNPYNNKDNVLKMQEVFIKKMSLTDSVSTFISTNRIVYSELLQQLAKNMYSKDSLQDSLLAPFLRGGFERTYFMLDNYKKKIAEDRKKIEPMKALYAADLKSSIYALSDSIAHLGMRIFLAIEKRDQYALEAGRLLNVLVNENMVGKDSLKQHTRYFDAAMNENICWLTDGSSRLNAVVKGYKLMLKRQKEMEEVIRWENRTEFRRYRFVNGEITWRKRKFGSIPPNNMHVCSRKKSEVAASKKEFLKKLKDERRKALEQTKKQKKE